MFRILDRPSLGSVLPCGMGWRLPILADSRGDRLAEYDVRRSASNPGNHCVYLDGTEFMAHQVVEAIGGDAALGEPLNRESGAGFNYFVRFEGAYRADLRGLLDLLKEVYTLPPPRELRYALALDRHTEPDGDGGFVRTATGERLYQAKYRNDRRAGSLLADELAAAVGTHPILRLTDRLVADEGTKNGFGLKLARAVGKRLDLPVSVATCATHGEEAKLGRADGTPTPHRIEDFIPFERVTIIDDVYMGGNTMRGVAAAVTAAGAAPVYGLVATRTLRSDGRRADG